MSIKNSFANGAINCIKLIPLNLFFHFVSWCWTRWFQNNYWFADFSSWPRGALLRWRTVQRHRFQAWGRDMFGTQATTNGKVHISRKIVDTLYSFNVLLNCKSHPNFQIWCHVCHVQPRRFQRVLGKSCKFSWSYSMLFQRTFTLFLHWWGISFQCQSYKIVLAVSNS